MRIVFFGTPEFAAFSLKKMIAAGFNIVAVVTATDKPAGRGMKLQESAVKKVAVSAGLKVLQPEKLKNPEFIEILRSCDADLGVVIAFRMLPEMVWSMPRLGTLNLHASLLPDFRGAAPINHAIIQGEKRTGVTTFFLKHEIDTGDIIMQREVEIAPEDDAGTLHDKLMETGAELLIDTLNAVSTGNWTEQPQQLTGRERTAPKLNRAFCQISGDLTVLEAHNKVRGLSPYPGAWIDEGGEPLKVTKTALCTEHFNEAGPIFISQRKLYFRCSDGWLELLRVQPAGKPAMDAQAYINGLANR